MIRKVFKEVSGGHLSSPAGGKPKTKNRRHQINYGILQGKTQLPGDRPHAQRQVCLSTTGQECPQEGVSAYATPAWQGDQEPANQWLSTEFIVSLRSVLLKSAD